jgi:hypothetical protein
MKIEKENRGLVGEHHARCGIRIFGLGIIPRERGMPLVK